MTAPPTLGRSAPPVSGGAERPPGPLATLRDLGRGWWTQLTSMRTALVLLFLLAVAAIPGSLLPQESLNPIKVQDYLAAHPTLGPLLERLGMFHVFSSPWFVAIYGLLFISLIGCVVPRTRAHVRSLRRPPPAVPVHLERLPEHARWVSPISAEEAAGHVVRLFRRSRWRTIRRVQRGGIGVSAERGQLRETGNLVFHLALLLLLCGVALGAAWGYTGYKLLIAGQTFTNVVPLYDQYNSGVMVSPGSMQPLTVTLDHFTATYAAQGEPVTFNAYIGYSARVGGVEHHEDLTVNHPLEFGQTRVYLIGHGYAPLITVRNRAGKVVYSSYVACLPQDGVFTSTCTIKVGDTHPEFGFQGYFLPTAAVTPGQGLVSVSPAPDRPALTLQPYEGDLGLNDGLPQSVYSLDTADLKPAGPAAFLAVGPHPPPGTTNEMHLPGGYTLSADRLRTWVTLEIKHDPSKSTVLVAAILIVAGLIASLRVKRRRAWARLTDRPDGTCLVEVAGLARGDSESFTEEFCDLLESLQVHVPLDRPAATAPTDPAGDPRSPGTPPVHEE